MVFNGFTAGDTIISIILFLQLTVGMVVAYHLHFRRIKIKNQ